MIYSALTALNSALSYINIDAKIKAKMYLIVSFFSTLYLGYVSYRFLANQIWFRGFLFTLLTLIFMYFLYVNVIYYFKNKTSKIDITPLIYKTLHIKVPEKEIKDKSNTINNNSNGIFNNDKTMPGTIKSTKEEQNLINTFANILIKNKVVKDDYDGLDDKSIKSFLENNKDKNKFYKLGTKSQVVPYFNAKKVKNTYEIYVGLNVKESYCIGKIKSVGFQNISNINLNEYNFYLANAYLAEGPYKQLGRSGLIEENDNYKINIELAYSKNEKVENLTKNSDKDAKK